LGCEFGFGGSSGAKKIHFLLEGVFVGEGWGWDGLAGQGAGERVGSLVTAVTINLLSVISWWLWLIQTSSN